MHCLLALCLALGATWAQAQDEGAVPQDSSVDVPIGGSYTFQLSDFPFADSDGNIVSQHFLIGTLPARGTLSTTDGTSADVGSQFFTFDFGRSGTGTPVYTPPADAISVASNYDSFMFNGSLASNAPTGTVTINMVGASTQMSATGAPTVTAASGPTYNTGVPMTASVVGVVEPNGISVGTLAWKWQQADAPASGTPATSAYRRYSWRYGNRHNFL